MNDARTLIRTIRIPFLILTPVSLLLGLATSLTTSAVVSSADFFLVLTGALFAHIGVNTLNEYQDFCSGLDSKTVKTPFSGGSGALVDNPGAADAVFRMAVISLTLMTAIGLYFVFRLGVAVLPLGVCGLLIIITYTRWLNRHPFLCLLAPGIGFGPLMVVGTHLVLTGQYSIVALLASMVPLFLASNLLLLNQFPDVDADRQVGRRHFPIAYGVRKSMLVYGGFVLAACGIVFTGILLRLLPPVSVIGIVPMGICIVVFFGAHRHSVSAQDLMPYMGLNVIATILTPVALSLGIIYG